MKKYNYINLSQFNSPDLPNSNINMSVSLLDILENVGCSINTVLTITSGYRSFAHNEKVGGVRNSSHTRGLACDIECTNSRYRYTLIGKLMELGINRIGIGRGFIHVDIDCSKDINVIWYY